MKGSPEIVELLNEVLTAELTAQSWSARPSPNSIS